LNKKPKIGIMQGRLSKSYNNQIQSFPIKSWKEEFKIAERCGFGIIEWIFDEIKPNPILASNGISEIDSLCKNHNISINSVCADYFMTKKLFSESEFNLEKNIKTFKELILSSKELGISFIEIPLVDSSSLKTNENKDELIRNLEKILPYAEKNDVNLVLETDLAPQNFKKFLEKIENQSIWANYDSGNSSSLGYNVKEELTLLKKWIKNVHVKDREFRGGTVPLGMGDTNFEEFFSTLFKIGYNGDLIIQGARHSENEHTPEQTSKIYLKFVNEYVNKYYN